MYPEIFRIGPLAIRSYGLMLAVAFFVGVLYVRRMALRRGRQPDPFYGVAYLMMFSGIFGARLAYVLFHIDEFAGNWTASFNPFGSDRFGIAGLNMYGGILAAVVASLIYFRVKKLPVLDTLDFFAPTVGLGLALARIGCFFNGCCFGKPTELPWGISFPDGSIPYYVYGDAHLHPAQLYSSLYGLGLFLVLHALLKRRRFAGQVLGLMFMIEAVFRIAIERVRYYEDEMLLRLNGFQPTFNEVISVGLFLLGLVVYLYGKKRETKSAGLAG